MMRTFRASTGGIVVAAVVAGGLALQSAPAIAAAPQQPVTKPATSITSITATLNGELNPVGPGEAGEYEFLYQQSATECTAGGVAPEPPGVALGASNEVVSTPLTNLEPSRQYTYCVLARHEAESSTGLPVTFETLAVAPTVDGESTPAITPFEATLAAQVNPNNQATTYAFEYATKATGEVLEGTITTVPGAEPLAAEFGERSASVSTGQLLTPDTPYFYRVVATNGTGTNDGKVQQFTSVTAEKPTIASEGVSGLTSTDAQLEAKINPNYQETSYHFEYSTKASGETLEPPITTVAGAPSLAAVFEEQLAGPTDLGGTLTPNTIYYYRVVASNATGESTGALRSFQASAQLTSTAAASEVTRTGARLSGTVNPGGVVTTYQFEYVDEAGYQAALAEGDVNPYALGYATLVGELPAGHATLPVGPESVAELLPGTTYHYALVATNQYGTITTPDQTFTTGAPTPPLLETGAPGVVTQNTADLTGSVNGRGLQTSYGFELGLGGGYGPPIELGSATGAAGEESVVFTLNGLLPGTIYHYRITATNIDGTSYGQDRTFTTVMSTGALTAQTSALLATPSIAFPGGSEANTGAGAPKKLTNAQKLSKALKSCKREPKAKRARCVKQAKRKYAPRKKGS